MTFSVMDEKRFHSWVQYAEKVSTTLANLENLNRCLDKECPPSEIDAPDMPSLDMIPLRVIVDVKIKELTESYIAIKDRIRGALKEAPPEFQEEHRIWMA